MASFYFYDLETSGFAPRTARIMQFGGQRTDLNLKPIGEPDNILIKMPEDVLPDPDAVLVHGITPQTTRADGVSEAEFVRYFNKEILKPDTIFVGFNNIRFDDEFMRHLFWRNFFDAYEWQWKDGRSRWDLLDASRMTRALRPEGIKWPFASDGTPSNRLEDLAHVNKLGHDSAHDALSDVRAALGLARLLKTKQPKLFDYLLNLRDKQKVAALVEAGQPIVYTSGRYPTEFEKTTVAVIIGQHPDKRGALMYDLRIDPDEFSAMSEAELAELWSLRGKDVPYFPVKLLSYNRAPAVAPLSVLDEASQKRLKLDMAQIKQNQVKLKAAKDFSAKLEKALAIVRPKLQPSLIVDEYVVDELLYDGFLAEADRLKMTLVRKTEAASLSELDPAFADERLNKMLLLYRARNFPKALSPDQQAWWENYRLRKLTEGGDQSRAAAYFKRIAELSALPKLNQKDRYLLEELNLYGQSILPIEEAA